MKRVVALPILVILCMLAGCIGGGYRMAAKDRPSVHVIYTPDPTSIPEELLADIGEPADIAVPVP